MSRMCLLCSAQLYTMMLRAFDNPDSAKLEEVMSRIANEGLDWLIEAAGGQPGEWSHPSLLDRFWSLTDHE
ncbi:hypothetical protein D3260_02235 [Salinisphaera sp. Q1T1-3]|nr:hypothetical protein D3260_02235 [Salinisphaera sp. Q1T1-3]